MVRHAVTSLPEATVVWLRGYFSPPWADAVADRTEDIETAFLDFSPTTNRTGTERGPHLQGAVAGITYHSQGERPAPGAVAASLASSQWDPLLSRLSARYRTVTLGGPALGFLAKLESRGHSAGYLTWYSVSWMPCTCGLGRSSWTWDVARECWIAGWPATRRRPTASSASTSTDIFSARPRPAMQEGLADIIAFQEGDAEVLPFPDNHVEVALSFTVLEEGNADRMLAELVRVAKPGGRVAVMVRAMDIPWVVNVPLRPELKAKAQTPRGFVGAQGCADASLYRRFQQAGLTHVQMWPQFAAFEQPETP